MSGPKVVRIVTREEVIARCQSDLRRVDAAIAEWHRVCERNGAADDKAITALQQRREALQRMLAEDRFVDLQKQAQLEIDFLKSDAEARIERATDAAARALQQRRRIANASRMLLEELEKSGRTIPPDLRRDLTSPQTQEQAITRALALLAPPARSEEMTEKQRGLADRLGGGQPPLTFCEWRVSHPQAEGAESDLKIDRQLAVLGALGVDTSTFARRVADIAVESSARQALLVDSLLVDLARAVKEARERSAQRAMLRQWVSELSADDSAEARGLCARMQAAITADDTSVVSALVAEAEKLSQARQRALAAAARRRAVLEGLAGLGYEVHEGMATAWVQGGHVVIRKASTPGYGVELSGGLKSERVQVRTVAFASAGSPRDASRDRDAETIWCGELARLRSSAASSGGSLEIEQALPAGAAPLKVIEVATQDSADEAGVVPRTLQR